MKERFLIILFFLGCFWLTAQQAINYKALIKDNMGNVLANQSVTIQFIILQDTGGGTAPVYLETHNPTTDANGIVIVNIGEGTTSYTFSDISWNLYDHFLNVQIDTGAGFTNMGTTQFMAVPYALNVTGLEKNGNNGWSLIGRDPNNYGDIGIEAIDLSYSDSASEVYGATGLNAVAMGYKTEASNFRAMAMGNQAIASGENSTAMGFQTVASGENSTAMGFVTTASGNNSTAMGAGTTASNNNSTALGNSTTASGLNSTAMGAGTTASGNRSTALGFYTVADDADAIVAGRFNDYTTATNTLFQIGNGINENILSNAFVVDEDGIVTAPSFDISEITDPKALITKEYFETNSITASGLEALDEGNGQGWRLAGVDENNYGSIGNQAVDLSINNNASTVDGATGNHAVAMGFSTEASGAYALATGYNTEASGEASTAMGLETEASGDNSTAFGNGTSAVGENAFVSGELSFATGKNAAAMGNGLSANALSSTALGLFNVGGGDPTTWVGTDPVFEIGNGTDFGNKSNALTILKNGTVTAPTFDMVEITDPKALITKEYADANYSGGGSGTSPTGLEALDEGNGTGWRLINSDPANFGDIGSNAIDLSTSSNPSSVNGATGPFSLAIGNNAEASGIAAMAIGFNSKAQNSGAIAIHGTVTGEGALAMAGGNASGQSSFAQGLSSVSSASYATALGNGTTASGDYAVAVGHNTTSSGWNSFSSGVNTEASGTQATAMGAGTVASGHSSTALGIGTKAEAPNTTAIGLYNIGGGDPLLASETDPLFEVGNGQYVDGVNDVRTNALTVLRNGTITAPTFDISEITDPKALITKEYADANYSGGGTGTSPTGLEALDEGSGIGWRLIGRNPDNYGAVGENAVDMSYNPDASEDFGALGTANFTAGYKTKATNLASTALGNETIASGFSTTALGFGTIADDQFSTVVGRLNDNTTATNILFQIGNGNTGGRSNAFNVDFDGVITAPSFDISEITDPKALITKEYADTNLSSTGLEALDEGNGTGWRLIGSDPTYYGNIGSNAIDLSISEAASSTIGATGIYSIAIGRMAEASGNFSTAIGWGAEASGYGAIAIGSSTLASGEGSVAMCSFSQALGEGSVAMNKSDAGALLSSAFGRDNISGGNSSSWVETDPLFEIGNGDLVNSNALTILKNGYTAFGTHEVLPTTDFQINHDNDGTVNGFKLQNKGTNENWWRFYTLNSNGQLYLYSKAGGNASPVGSFDDASGAYTALSDRRAKANFKDLYFNWQEFMQLQPLTYHYKSDENKKSHIGFVAQDVQPIYPELVNHNKEDDLYQLNYSGFGVVAIKAIQELKKENEQLKALLLKEEQANAEQSQVLQALLERVETLEKQQSKSAPVQLVKN